MVKRKYLNDFTDPNSPAFVQVAPYAAFDVQAVKGAISWINDKHIS
ncbi:hypothetical protein GCM10027044_02610 [Hymenobacter ruber]